VSHQSANEVQDAATLLVRSLRTLLAVDDEQWSAIIAARTQADASRSALDELMTWRQQAREARNRGEAPPPRPDLPRSREIERLQDDYRSTTERTHRRAVALCDADAALLELATAPELLPTVRAIACEIRSLRLADAEPPEMPPLNLPLFPGIPEAAEPRSLTQVERFDALSQAGAEDPDALRAAIEAHMQTEFFPGLDQFHAEMSSEFDRIQRMVRQSIESALQLAEALAKEVSAVV
jgi:hypothetical protein